jgi:hypothetical protein
MTMSSVWLLPTTIITLAGSLGGGPSHYRHALTHGFLYDVTALEFQSVNDPRGVDTTDINGINDVGQIVGFFVDPITGNTNGFVGRIARCVD